MRWPENELAYLAGIIDGEGSLTVGFRESRNNRLGYECSPSYSARMSVEMTDRATIAHLQAVFGGRFTERHRGDNRRVIYAWNATDAQARKALEIIAPYLRVKREQSRLLLALPIAKSKQRKPQEDLDEAERIRQEVSRLNREG
jgi:hypothetical protein